MIVSVVKQRIAGRQDSEDASSLFKCNAETISMGELRQLIEGRDGSDSVMAKSDGVGVRVFTPFKLFTR